MNKLNNTVFVFIFGFLLNPVYTYGCNSSKENTQIHACCQFDKESQTVKKEEKSCCENSKSEKKSCDGSCSNSNCNVVPGFSSIIPLFSFTFNSSLEKIVSQKVNFFYLEKNIPTHFFSIWAPPKIS